MTLASAGTPLKDARAAVLMLHGRGGRAEDILGLASAFRQADLAFLAPQAPGHTWYLLSFLAPLEQNEPYLSQSLAAIDMIVQDLAGRGIAPGRVVLIGFFPGRKPRTALMRHNLPPDASTRRSQRLTVRMLSCTSNKHEFCMAGKSAACGLG